MLLVDHRQAQIGEIHALLEQGVGADRELHRAGGEMRAGTGARGTLDAAGEQSCRQWRQPAQGAMVLAREDFGRRHQRRLRAGFRRRQHRQHRNQGLAGADIALQQAHHTTGGGKVGIDLGKDALLCRG